ncbi:MAG: hypothetical protein ABJA10_10340, partial [Aestuariivirga sp.]
RVLKDEAIAEIAIQMPQSSQDVNELRLVSRGAGNSAMGTAILKAVQDGLARDPKTVPDKIDPKKCHRRRRRQQKF